MPLTPDEKRERLAIYRRLAAYLNDSDHGDQKHFADQTGIGPSLLSKFLSGKGKTCGIDTARKIQKGLDAMSADSPSHSAGESAPPYIASTNDMLIFIASRARESVDIIADPKRSEAERIREIGRLANIPLPLRRRRAPIIATISGYSFAVQFSEKSPNDAKTDRAQPRRNANATIDLCNITQNHDSANLRMAFRRPAVRSRSAPPSSIGVELRRYPLKEKGLRLWFV